MDDNNLAHGRCAVRALLVLRRLLEGPASRDEIKSFLLLETGEIVDERTLGRSLRYLRAAGFEARKNGGAFRLAQEAESKSKDDQETETAAKAAARLGISRNRATRLAASGRWPGAQKVGREWRIPRDSAPVASSRGPSGEWEK